MDSKKPIVNILDPTALQAREEKRDYVPDKKPAPQDKFYFAYIIMLTLGITSLMVASYIISAIDFWMYKFRNTTRPWHGAGDAENRTYLQKTVLSFIMIATAVPSLLCLILVFIVIPRTATRARITTCYSIITFILAMFFLLAVVNTDTWQFGLLIITLLLAALNSGAFVILLASCITLLASFPPSYVKAFMIGQGVAAIITSLIQTLCLAVGNDSQISGLIYFGIAVVIYLFTIVMYVNSRRFPFYTHYVDETRDANNKPTQILKPTVADLKLALSEVWPVIVVHACCIVGLHLDNVGALVVSENRGDGTAWTEKFFVPVITLFLGNVCGLIGRLCASDIVKPNNRYIMVGINIVRAMLFLPLYIGCNAFPRTMPVWFPHDWQYIIIMGTFQFSNGYFTTCALLSLPNFASNKVQKEIYYLLLQVTLSTVGFASAPLNMLVVSYIL